eukprot:m.270851 g.270851  ORF g.270851 m.270851 type:complete len:439 (-) comp91883_c0_seq1:31-1347(-)
MVLTDITFSLNIMHNYKKSLLLVCVVGALVVNTSTTHVHVPVQIPQTSLMTVNPIKNLPSLQKAHFSWPFPEGYLINSSISFMDGFLHDYVRITGSCPISVATASELTVTTCSMVCSASASDPKSCLALNYSPWYAKFPGSDPTVTGPPEQAEMQYFEGKLTNISRWLNTANMRTAMNFEAGDTRYSSTTTAVGVGAFLLDSEKFSVTPDSTLAEAVALTRKCNLMFNASVATFPNARIEWYNRGEVSLSYTYGWIGPIGANETMPIDKQWDHFTLNERGSTLSTSIYNIRDLYQMRETYHRTVQFAKYKNSTRRPLTGVTPWLALGCGDHLVAAHNCSGNEQRYNEPCKAFDFHSPYDPVLSWQLGNELNNLSQYNNTENPSHSPAQAFAPWNNAEVVCLYPSILDLRASPTGNGSTSMVDHFVAYVRGAVGLDGVS